MQSIHHNFKSLRIFRIKFREKHNLVYFINIKEEISKCQTATQYHKKGSRLEINKPGYTTSECAFRSFLPCP